MGVIFMLGNTKIVVKDILFVEHSRDAKRGNHIFDTKDVYHHQLLYKLGGEAIVTFNGKRMRERTDDVRFLPSPSAFRHLPDYSAEVVELCEFINIGFVSDSPLPTEILVKNCSNHPSLKLLFQKLHKHWYYKRNDYYHKCVSILYEIFYELSSNRSDYVSSRTYQLIAPAVDFIDDHFTESHMDYEALAALCGISYTYMAKIFVKHFGASPNRYVMGKKIQYACDLLNTRCYSVHEIAQMSGFANTYYFSRIFKKYTKVSPTEYNKTTPV
jgi:AraC-like DNA-binding protein